MHTTKVLHNWLVNALPDIHTRRISSLVTAVESVARGATLSITSMGRYSHSNAFIKHRIKRMDRLVGNRFLFQERQRIYQMLSHWLLSGNKSPLILIDWSDLTRDQSQHVLRASTPVGGRSLTLYEEIHPRSKLANRLVQHAFLDVLRTTIPAHCVPIVIADSGFRVPFYRHVEALGWQWLGRIRHRDFIAWKSTPDNWFAAKTLYDKAATTAHELGNL